MTLLFLILMAIFAGGGEAILYCRRGAEAFEGNEHVALRGRDIAAVLAAVGAVVDHALWASYPQLAALLGAFPLAFSFAHNNAYNFVRIWIDEVAAIRKDPARAAVAFETNRLDWLAFRLARARFDWQYQSPTTTARFDFSAKERTLQLVLASGVVAATVLTPWGHWVAGAALIGWSIRWHIVTARRPAQKAA